MFVLLSYDAFIFFKYFKEILDLDLQLVLGSAEIVSELLDVLVKAY